MNIYSKKTVIKSLVFTLLGLILVLHPVLFSRLTNEGLDMAFYITGFLLIIASLTTAIIFLIIYRQQITSFQEGKILARWVFSSEEWVQHAIVQYRNNRHLQKTLFFILSIFTLFIGFAFFFLDTETGLEVFFITILITAVSGLIFFLSIRLKLQKLKTNPGKIIISTDAVYYIDEYYSFKPGKNGTIEAKLLIAGNIRMLEIRQRSNSNNKDSDKVIRIPVPTEKVSEAENIAILLNKQYNQK